MLSLLLACAPAPTLDTLPLAEQLAAQGQSIWPPETLAFDWMQTVWGYGLLRLDAIEGTNTYTPALSAWMDSELDDFTADPPRDFNSSDSTSPAGIAAALLAKDATLPYQPIVAAAERYLLNPPTTSSGAIVHWGPGSPFGDTTQVWIDSHFMLGLFLFSQHDRGLGGSLDIFVTQYNLWSELCRDAETDLYYHAYDDLTGENIPSDPVFWARGNAWVLVAAVEAIERGAPLEAPFAAQAAAILALQDDDGLWRTVLNSPMGEDPDNYTETSGSALIVAALARGTRLGVLDPTQTEPAIARATAALDARIERGEDGLIIEGTSFGTNPGDYDYYVSVTQLDDIILGWGATIAALAEVHGMPAEAE